MLGCLKTLPHGLADEGAEEVVDSDVAGRDRGGRSATE